MAIGYDSINVRVTPSIGREAKKLLATIKPADCPPPSKRPKVESTKVPEGVLDFTRDNPPDKDGYYHFTVSKCTSPSIYSYKLYKLHLACSQIFWSNFISIYYSFLVVGEGQVNI